jgi:hypothetical protein
LSTNLKINTYLRQLSLESKKKKKKKNFNNAIHFSTNSILNDEIKKIKNNQKTKNRKTISYR